MGKELFGPQTDQARYRGKTEPRGWGGWTAHVP